MTAHHFSKTRKTIWNTMPERDKRKKYMGESVRYFNPETNDLEDE